MAKCMTFMPSGFGCRHRIEIYAIRVSPTFSAQSNFRNLSSLVLCIGISVWMNDGRWESCSRRIGTFTLTTHSDWWKYWVNGINWMKEFGVCVLVRCDVMMFMSMADSLHYLHVVTALSSVTQCVHWSWRHVCRMPAPYGPRLLFLTKPTSASIVSQKNIFGQFIHLWRMHTAHASTLTHFKGGTWHKYIINSKQIRKENAGGFFFVPSDKKPLPPAHFTFHVSYMFYQILQRIKQKEKKLAKMNELEKRQPTINNWSTRQTFRLLVVCLFDLKTSLQTNIQIPSIWVHSHSFGFLCTDVYVSVHCDYIFSICATFIAMDSINRKHNPSWIEATHIYRPI